MTKIAIGDEVAYSAQYLRDTAQQTGWAASRRGMVKGFSPEIPELAIIAWRDGVNGHANIANLTTVKRIGADSALSKPGFMQLFRGLR